MDKNDHIDKECSNCAAFVENARAIFSTDDYAHQCRLKPPVVYVDEGMIDYAWPEVERGDFCLQWQHWSWRYNYKGEDNAS